MQSTTKEVKTIVSNQTILLLLTLITIKCLLKDRPTVSEGEMLVSLFLGFEYALFLLGKTSLVLSKAYQPQTP